MCEFQRCVALDISCCITRFEEVSKLSSAKCKLLSNFCRAFIMDSMSNLLTPYSNYTVKGIRRFLMAMGVINDNMLTPVPVKVSNAYHYNTLLLINMIIGLPADY